MKPLRFGILLALSCACSTRSPQGTPPEHERVVPEKSPQAPHAVPWGDHGHVVATKVPVALRSRVRFAGSPDDLEPLAEVGASLLLLYEKQNTGTESVAVWHAGFWPNHRILVLTDRGMEPPLTSFGKSAVEAFSPRGKRGKNVEWVLKPGAIDGSEGAQDLSRLYDLSESGHYTVRVDYEEETVIRSNTLPFWLLPVGSTALISRLNAWDREECDVFEREAEYPGRVSSGETNGYLETHKDELRKLGVQVAWDADARRYVVKDVRRQSER